MPTSRDDLPLDDYRALAQFRHLLRRFLAFSQEAADSEGLAPQQHQLLLAIKGLPPGRSPTISALASQLQLRHHSVVELANRTAKEGLSRRVRGGQDRREVLLEITPKGEQLLRRLSIRHREELRKLGPALVRALGGLLRAGRLGSG